MPEQKQNAQVAGGVNDDISELKSLTQLRKRVVSDGEIVSRSENAFRLAGGNTGVILRKDNNDFYMLTTAGGQSLDGQWNTLRPFSFNLNSGRVSLRNGVDIAGGAVISHNAGISTATTGPASLIAGQTYDAAPVNTDFTTGNITTRMMIGSRVITGKEDYGLLSYRDFQGNWNEVQLKRSAELVAGQLTKRNQDGWFWAKGNRDESASTRITNGMRVQGAGDLFADIYHYERIGQHHFFGIHVANGGADGWYEFHNNGEFFAGNSVHAGAATLAPDGNVNGSIWGGWLHDWLLNNNSPTVNAANRGAIDGRIQWWMANAGAGTIGTLGLLYNQSGHDINPGDIIPGSQLRWASAGERQAWAPSDGAWRALGTAQANGGRDGDEVTLYVRIS